MLEQWLEQRGLDTVLMQQLQSRLESTSDADKRTQVARRLANLYAKELLNGEGPANELIKRTRDLIAIYPQFESGRLRVAMLHARYLESETQFRDWIENGAPSQARVELQKTLTELDDDLSGAILALSNRSEELFAAQQLDGTPSRLQREVGSERQQVDAETLHCQFLAGWTRYFRALSASKERQQILEKSELGFREFLQLDPQTVLSDFDSRWFDFSSAWHVRATAGLAAIAIARRDESQSNYLYKLLDSNAISRDGREAVIRFRFLAHCYCGQYAEAANVLRASDAIGAMSREGKIRLWATVLKTSKVMGLPEVQQIALAGLTRNMAGELLVEQLTDVGLKSIQDKALKEKRFEIFWIAGYAEFWKSIEGDEIAAEKANDLLSKAIQFSSDETNAIDQARCRYLLAWLTLKDRNFPQAIQAFSEVATQLETADPQLASESAWLAASASIDFAKQNPAQISETWNRLEHFVRSWPDSPHALRARFEKLRIELRSMPAKDAIGRLEEIDEADENYSAAISEMVAQRFRIWERQPNESTLNRLRQSSEAVQISDQTNSLQKTRAGFLLTGAVLKSENADLDEVASLLQRCDRWLGQVKEPEQAIVELLYYRWQLQQRRGDSEAALTTVSELVQRGRNTRFEIPALIELAKDRDAKIDEKTEKAVTKEAIEQAILVYQQLSDRLGREPEQLRASANSRIAYARLGELKQMAGRDNESETIFQTLVATFPDQAGFLRSLAIAKSKRDATAASDIWRRLASGSTAGSDLWYESKLELAKGLSEDDHDAAASLIRQTIQLGGELPPRWQEEYGAMLFELSDQGESQ